MQNLLGRSYFEVQYTEHHTYIKEAGTNVETSVRAILHLWH